MDIIMFGTIGSGRTTAAQYMKQKGNFELRQIAAFMHMVIKSLNYQELDYTTVQQEFAAQARHIFGPHVWNEHLSYLIQQNQQMHHGYGGFPPNFIIWDGKTKDDLIFWKDRGFLDVGVITDVDLCCERLVKSGHLDPSKYLQHSSEKEVRKIASQCKFKIYNNGDLADLQQQVDTLFSEIYSYNSDD